MITLISCTNRAESNTILISKYYQELIERHSQEEVHFLDLAKIDLQEYSNLLYSEEGLSDVLATIQDKLIKPASKLVFIVPEYNGGMPGILKLFIDAMSVRDYEATFHMKKACLTGLSSGRAGNLRGLEHLTGILNYLQVVVFPNRLPISKIENFVAEGKLDLDQETINEIQLQVTSFLKF